MAGERVAVIMAGGSGERFWPLSRPGRPKQLLYLTDPKMTMLEEAVHRVRGLIETDRIFVSTSRELAEPIREADLLNADNVVSEPTKRNTLGALVWLAAVLHHRGLSEATVAVLTSDHKIGDVEIFRRDVSMALSAAEQDGGLVTLGIPPTRPETGFGYMQAEPSTNGRALVPVSSFREKPSLESAMEFVASPNFFWNSGMLFYTLASFREALRHCQPVVYEAYERIIAAFGRNDDLEAIRAFETIPNISFDFAVMERAESVSMIPASFPWDDVGSWDALARSFSTDLLGNTLQGCTAVIESRGCIIVNDVEDSVVGVIGLKDCIVVNTREGVLVCPKNLAQRVREVSVASAVSLANHVSVE
ncbi:MAG: mannose-1-phosphate guanylyltransferase [Fimbriimonas sp.]|nr:mannose-1-phosphate guanylyltransferase [Fimbriimonas sp.]